MQYCNLGLLSAARIRKAGFGAIVLCGLLNAAASEQSTLSPDWNFGAGLGVHFFEGDQETRHGLVGVLQGAYDLGDHWTLESTLSLMPSLRANRIESRSTDRPDGDRPGLHERTASTWAAGLALDGRYHFTRQYRFDPYLRIGAGSLFYGDRRDEGGHTDLAVRAGCGAFYHVSETLALRLDLVGMRVFNIGQANAQITMGLAWTPGGISEPAFQVLGGVRDSDGDGLSDWEEINIYFTDPYNPDTDGDGLSDYEELIIHGTDPHNPDTDGDGLTDYEEVVVYGTDPLRRDTDGGGVDDWHEIMVDGTDPLDPADDLQLYTLRLEFDFDQAIIQSRFYHSLDVIGLTLERDPPATARIEGHADRLRDSKEEYNHQLSERRARAVKQYLVERSGIEPHRLQAVGYGFQRPKEPNDPETGNPVNRRVEIYVRSGEHIERFGERPPENGLPGALPRGDEVGLPAELPAETK